MADPVLVVDRTRHVVAANRAYMQTFGTSPSPVGAECTAGVDCLEHHLPPSDPRVPCTACRVAATGQPETRIYRSSRAGGQDWEVSFSPIRGTGGDVTHVLEVWRDIRDRARLQAQIAHAERLSSLGLLAAGVSHEVNNPLASVMVATDALSRTCSRADMDPELLQEVDELVRTIRQGIARCRETTGRLMQLAQPRSQEAAPVDLNSIVRECLSLLEFQMRKQRIRSELDLTEEPIEVWSRESGLVSLCMNLMLNAVQAMPDGGTLSVSTRGDARQVQMVIRDTGPGVPPDVAAKIWEPFFTTKSSGSGTGLGLTICLSIVSAHGGSIRLDRRGGGGARFVVELPRHRTEAADA